MYNLTLVLDIIRVRLGLVAESKKVPPVSDQQSEAIAIISLHFGSDRYPPDQNLLRSPLVP
jgi:hypothetical protein